MMKLRTFGWFSLIVFAFAASPSITSAQTVGDWQMLRPEGEEFGILMPKNSTVEKSTEPYHKMTLNMRLYLWTSPDGPVFAVASIAGIKSNPAMYTEMQRVNSYVDAFKRWFPKKIQSTETIAKLTPTKEKALNGHAGREYDIVVGDLSGVTQVYATRRRFYAIVSLNKKKDESLSERFLSSFELPERINEPPPKIAQQKPEKQAVTEQVLPETEGSANPQPPKPDQAKAEGKPAGEAGSTESEAKPAESATATEPGKRAPISGGVLNGKAITLPKPEYPAIARQAHASGTVVVQVTIDEYGNVIAARAVSGHPLLQGSAVAAAREAKFSPTFMMGEPVKVTGVITYAFVAQ
ncbi:MAG TPA: TonB family protein [Pyrinomonadaceae bacterium]|nr:TonB family protein [Pyrinomonadaceae bacterium]